MILVMNGEWVSFLTAKSLLQVPVAGYRFRALNVEHSAYYRFLRNFCPVTGTWQPVTFFNEPRTPQFSILYLK
jgi:hypothetical protein